jgi:hypothetical protein
MMRFVVNESGYSEAETVSGLSAAGMAKKYDNTYYLYANSAGSYYAHSSDDGLAFGTGANLMAGTINSNQMEKIGNKYYLFYMQDQTALRVARSDTPNSTFTYFQQLYSGYRMPSDTMLFDTNKVLMTNALSPENPTTRFYVDQLSMNDLTMNTDIWSVTDSPIVVSGEVQLNNSEQIMSVDTFGFGTIVTARSKADEQDIAFVGYTVDADNYTELSNIDYVMNDDFDNIICMTHLNGSAVSPGLYNDGWSDFRNTFHQYTIERINTSYFAYSQGSNTNFSADSAYMPTGDASIQMRVWNSSQESTLISDWVFVRKYTATEPTATLGAEENASAGGLQITATANQYTQFNDWETDHTFAQIAALNANDVCYSWYNHTSGLHEAYYVGRTYNAAKIIPMNCSVLGFFDTETIVDVTARTSITIPNAAWFYGFMPGSCSNTTTEIDSSMDADGLACQAVYRWDGSAWNTSGTVEPKQGIITYNSNAGVWTP